MSAERRTLPIYDWRRLDDKTALADRRSITVTKTYTLYVSVGSWACTCGAYGKAHDIATARISADLHASGRHQGE